MAVPGNELNNPATGLRTVFRETAESTSGELLQVDWIGDPGWTTGPDHVHRLQEERFEVLSGSLGLRVDGVEGVHGPGEVIVAAAGSPHAAWNAGEEDVHLLVEFRPALRTEIAFETLAGLARDGKTTKAGSAEEPVACGADPAPFRGRDLLRPTSAGRSAGDLRDAGHARAAARLSGRVPLPLCQPRRSCPEHDGGHHGAARATVIPGRYAARGGSCRSSGAIARPRWGASIFS